MYYEIFRFELKYRLKRPETYLFFFFLFLFSVFGVDFIFQGVELGLVKKNAPMVIGKTMGAISGIFMIMASMIMGMPMIRDDRYQITDIVYTKPIQKKDLLFGRFFGSFLILFLIFSGIPLGMMVGEMLPWHLPEEMHEFNFTTYLNGFATIVFPILFFGSALFFVTGMLSRNLLVVYTQGIFMFVIFMLTKAIPYDYLQAILDPFSLTTITQFSKNWTPEERNIFPMALKGVLLANKLFWFILGIIIMWYGYAKFKFTTHRKTKKSNKKSSSNQIPEFARMVEVPEVTSQFGFKSQAIQLLESTIFFTRSLLKETSFWAIVICGIIIILINSVNLGTVYGVDSYPTTYFIIEELQEMSLYFFIIILLFYSGELFWKENKVHIKPLTDATPISSLIIIGSKTLGLIAVYIVLMLTLIICGIIFQITKGYYHFDLQVYLTGFFIEILPFLIIYTMAAFFFQSLVNNKFIGIIITLMFFITTIALGQLGINHVLLNFGGSPLMSYSEMNGYGHYLTPYIWTKIYWTLICLLFLIVASLISSRGIDVKLIQRLKKAKSNLTSSIKKTATTLLIICSLLGTYLTYQTSVVNENWSEAKQLSYRAGYEKTLKQFEYQPQVKITEANLILELYPEERVYELDGEYVLKNDNNSSITEIHIQKLIDADVEVENIQFSRATSLDTQYHEYEYLIYKLADPLISGDSLKMKFKQTAISKGFNSEGGESQVLYNGTFIRNNELPTIAYNNKYEIRDKTERKNKGLKVRESRADLDDIHELKLARNGDDSYGITTKITLGTSSNQTAITSGKLTKKWKENNRNYFRYESNEPMINFYCMLSGNYEVRQDYWKDNQLGGDPVSLEIYHHPRHTYNLDRMMKGMKASLSYFTVNFSPYQYEQLRIVEFPRYAEFAQSFPNTIPFSESIGFMLDIDNKEDVDMSFFVTAHEVAHQWWGMQVETANVKGRNLVLETLAQYSAVMVFKNQFPQEKVDQFLALQLELYDKGKSKSREEEENPLYMVENEEHIYYNKGAIVMYQLQEILGEENVNMALRMFINDWNSKDGRIKVQTERYATSENLISYFLKVTPEQNRREVLSLFMEI